MTFRSRARTDNSLLRSKYLGEQVAWIGGVEVTSFGELVFSDSPRVVILAQSLNLPPGEEDTRATTLNKIFLYLGVSCMHLAFLFRYLFTGGLSAHSQIQYRAVPSRASILLMPSMTSLG